MTHPYFVVDVFAESRFTGNQLAVVVCQTPLSEEQMQKIAVETNYSETTFVSPIIEDNGGYNVRIFTPSQEIAFAGHPILGTAWVIRKYINTDNSGPILLNLSVGQVPVVFERGSDQRDIAWFLAPPVKFGRSLNKQGIANGVGLEVDDIDGLFPIQEVSAGVSAIMVPLTSLDALRRVEWDVNAYSNLVSQDFPSLYYFFCRETYNVDNDLCARFFFYANGVREDPATGNGAAFLGNYLLRYRVFKYNELSLRIEQGQQVQRPSLVRLKAKMQGEEPAVYVGGKVVTTVVGKLLTDS